MWGKVAIGVVVLGFLAGLYGLGYQGAKLRDAKTITQAQADLHQCEGTAQAQAATIVELQAHFAQEKRDAADAIARANAELATRDAELQQIERRGQVAADAVRNAAHDSPDAAALGRLPVPHAIARELWPGAAGTSGAANH